jgi:Mn-dependent DtxR family transcriptional regulator
MDKINKLSSEDNLNENRKALLNLHKMGLVDFNDKMGVEPTLKGLDVLEAFLLLDTYNEAKLLKD